MSPRGKGREGACIYTVRNYLLQKGNEIGSFVEMDGPKD